MNMNMKKLISMVLVLACVFSMAACKSKDEGDKKEEGGEEKKTLVMATNAEFEPYEYHEGDEIIGIDVDIARAICDKLGYELKIEDMEFDSILPAVEAGKADFGAAGMTVTDERKENADFTDTYTNATQVVIIKK